MRTIAIALVLMGCSNPQALVAPAPTPMSTTPAPAPTPKQAPAPKPIELCVLSLGTIACSTYVNSWAEMSDCKLSAVLGCSAMVKAGEGLVSVPTYRCKGPAPTFDSALVRCDRADAVIMSNDRIVRVSYADAERLVP